VTAAARAPGRPAEPVVERVEALAGLVVGGDVMVPVAGAAGRTARCFANLDHAASTPPFWRVLAAVNEAARWYANVHRGAGFKSCLTTWAYEQARAAVLRFTGADPAHAVALFTRNTTEALNLLAARLAVPAGAVVLVTEMEHHSNDLPWRRAAPGRVVHVRVLADGRVDEADLLAKLRRFHGRVAVLAASGASNVTGLVNPVHRWARWAHEAGALIVVDAAQLAPHRPIDVRPPGDPAHLDFVAFSAHKLYAPFGAGALVGSARLLAEGEPYQAGGGTVDSVGLDSVAWTALPDREEAGTPPVLGALALAAAIAEIERVGWPRIEAHERALAARLLARLASVPGLAILGPGADARHDRVGVVAFDVAGVPHGLVAAVLAAEWGIGTRSGCFCAHPYVKRLLDLSPGAIAAYEARVAAGDRGDLPGAVRASLGLGSTAEDVDRLGDALLAVAAGRYRAGYACDPAHGTWHHPEDLACFETWLRADGALGDALGRARTGTPTWLA